MSMVTTLLRFAASTTLLLTCGCSTLPDGREWGADATLRPGWARIRDAATGAAQDPWVWGPLAGAAVLQVGDWDREVSDWAQRETPLFGSREDARQWSDDLRLATTWAYTATALATPSGDEDWIENKARGIAVGLSARALTSRATSALKRTVDRERPDGTPESFPSGHSSGAAVSARLASRNLRAIDMPPATRRALGIGLHALTFGTAWARVEAGVHYPSDTLFGIALGNFLGAFINDAFLGLESDPRHSLRFAPHGDGAAIVWRREF